MKNIEKTKQNLTDREGDPQISETRDIEAGQSCELKQSEKEPIFEKSRKIENNIITAYQK